jgi:hypothetical protein
VVLVIVSAVGELFLEALTNEETIIGVDGQVTSIKERMEI